MACAVHAKTHVTEIEERADCVVARTENGTIRAESIVYAAGYETEQLLDETKGFLHSTYAVASEPGFTVPGWPEECLLWETAGPIFTRGERKMGGRSSAEETPLSPPITIAIRWWSEKSRTSWLASANSFPKRSSCRSSPGQEPSPKPRMAWPSSGNRRIVPERTSRLGYGGNGITFSVIAAKLISDLYAGRPNPDAAVFRFGRYRRLARRFLFRGDLAFFTGSSGDSAGPARTSPPGRNREP